MAQTPIKINLGAYLRTHGHDPRTPQHQGRSMWAFTIDASEQVTVKYGTYQEALAWAQTLAQTTITVWP